MTTRYEKEKKASAEFWKSYFSKLRPAMQSQVGAQSSEGIDVDGDSQTTLDAPDSSLLGAPKKTRTRAVKPSRTRFISR